MSQEEVDVNAIYHDATSVKKIVKTTVDARRYCYFKLYIS